MYSFNWLKVACGALSGHHPGCRQQKAWFLLAALWTFAGASATAHAERIKDLATVAGVRANQLVGYGLVVGLDGTGDQTSQAPFTIQSITNMLARFGRAHSPGTNPQLKNVAAVTVTADLPAFSKTGQTIDVTVASIGNASSLRGGSLLMTPLRGVDGQVYAFAQGSMVVSGFGISGKTAPKYPSMCRAPAAFRTVPAWSARCL